MEKMTSEIMRDFNRHQIYNLIYTEKRISRQSIAEKLKLSLPTVSQHLKILEQAQLIKRNGFFDSTGGRKSIAYSCVSNAKIAVGAHITQSSISLVAVDIFGEVIKRKHLKKTYSHCRDYYKEFGETIDSFIKSLNISSKRILGVGIALTAILSKDKQYVSKSILLGTNEASLADFKEWIDYPCQLFHDSEAAADAELWFSPNISDALYLGINYHLNGVLIMNGKIHIGKEYTGGLVEHITLYPGGRDCYCGKKGCFTTYCSGRLLYGESDGDCEKYFASLRSGSKAAVDTWRKFLSDMAIAIGSLSALLDCDIILGGTVGAYMIDEDRLFLQQAVRSNFQYAPASDFICLGYKDVDVCACGAGIAYISDFIKNL